MMWELIRANKRRSMVLVAVMLLLLALLGFVIGVAVFPGMMEVDVGAYILFVPVGGLVGLGVAVLLWSVQATAAYFGGGAILMASSKARPIEKQDHPMLFNIVEEMTIAARLPKMPKIYIIDDMSMNAFAAGRGPDDAMVAVTAGLLGRMNRDQLQGVIAHEISHIVHRDVLFMTMIGVMVGTIVILSELFLRSVFYGMGSSRRYSGRGSRRGGGGGAQILLIALAIVLAIVAPLLAYVIYFACSRRREYLADAGAAVYTRYPEGLASALELIGNQTRPLESANKATAPMYIANPFGEKKASAFGLTATHPPIPERVRILRSIAGNASFQSYQSAWAKVSGAGAANMPASALGIAPAPLRGDEKKAPQPKESAMESRQRMRQAGDLLRKIHHFMFIACACGARIKIPPDYKHDIVQCPRCGRKHPRSEAKPIPEARVKAS